MGLIHEMKKYQKSEKSEIDISAIRISKIGKHCAESDSAQANTVGSQTPHRLTLRGVDN